jgi:hypothetical protein
MCHDDPAYTIFLRCPAGGNMANGRHEFRDVNLTRWPRSSQWRVRCVSWTMVNDAPAALNTPCISLHLEGFEQNGSNTAAPLCVASQGPSTEYIMTGRGSEMIGSLDGRVLRTQVRDAATGAAETTAAWVAVLECRPVS